MLCCARATPNVACAARTRNGGGAAIETIELTPFVPQKAAAYSAAFLFPPCIKNKKPGSLLHDTGASRADLSGVYFGGADLVHHSVGHSMEQRQRVLYSLGNTAYEPGSGSGAGGIGVAASRRVVHSIGCLEGISGRLTGHFP